VISLAELLLAANARPIRESPYKSVSSFSSALSGERMIHSSWEKLGWEDRG
jgi:hypothetical protein